MKFRFVLSLFILLTSVVNAQYNSFINISIEDGLAQSQVNCIHQDATGYLWIATVSGLSRYDGTAIQNFYKSDGLVDNLITFILEDESGTLYFGGAGGFSTYGLQGFESYSFPKSLVDSRVEHMSFSNDSTLWIATSRDGYFSFSMKSKKFSVPNTKLGSNIRWMDISKGLIAGRRGIYHKGKLWDPIFAEVNVSDVLFEGNEVWVSTLGDGLFHFNGAWEQISEDEFPNTMFVRDMCLTSRGDFWLAGPEGAMKREGNKWKEFNSSNGLDYHNIRQISEDREGNIWLASNGQGVFRFTGETFASYRTGNPLQSELMLSATERDGDLFLGMFDEPLQVLGQNNTVHTASGILNTDVWSLILDSKQRIWAGTSTGLYRSMNGYDFREVFEGELPSNRVTALHEDEYGNIWVGHRDGISVIFSDTEIDHYTSENDFKGKRIRAINQSVDGAIWAGAQNGLFRIADDWVLHLGEEHGLNDNTIYSIQDDSYGRLWVGAKNGLHILQNDTVLQVLISGRVDANNINFIHSSTRGYLYIGTNQGLFSAKVKENIDDMEFQGYGIADGLPGLECNLNAVYQAEDGNIWFGTNKGVVQFSEEKLIALRSKPLPHLQITDIKLFAEPIVFNEFASDFSSTSGLPLDLVFQPKENHITFDFKGVRLTDPESIQYQYYMEGLDESWLPASGARSVTYSSLSFGNYCFKVRCVNSVGTVLGNQVNLNFRILPPIYLRWWALLLELALISILFYLILNWRRQVRMRKNNMIELTYRNRMQSLEQQSLNSSMNRHFIFNSLNAIQFYINREDKRSANRYLSSFAKLIRKNLDSTSNTWVSLHDELERLELYLSLEYMRFRDKFSYDIAVDSSLNMEQVKVPAMMLQPFVENSIWHGILPKDAPGKVLINVSAQKDRLRIRIQDDGIGIDESRLRKGSVLPDHESKGMEITHHRLRLYGEMTGTAFEVVGPVQLEEENEILGTRIDLFIPLVSS